MRLALRLLLLAGLAPVLFLGAGAYQAAELEGRSIGVSIVTDGVAYLAVSANPAHAYDCLVSTVDGKVSVAIDALDAGCASAGAGLGIPAGDGSTAAKYSRYAFHDLLLVTNKGTRAIKVWVNATTETNANGAVLDVAKKATSATMVDADYAASSATSLDLAVGASGYVGIRANSGTMTAGQLDGTIVVTGRGA